MSLLSHPVRRTLLLLVLAPVASLCLAGSASASDSTSTPASDVALYCVEKDPDYVGQVQVHGGVKQCVPVP